MCGSEPCRHERTGESEHVYQEFAGTQRDTLTSFIKTSGALTAMTAERDAALAALARVRALVRPLGILYAASPSGLWALRCKNILDDLRAALEPTSQPKGKKP
jgi:hypothetical protein